MDTTPKLALISASFWPPSHSNSAGPTAKATVDLPSIPGFAVSTFGPLVHAVSTACLGPPGGVTNHVAGQKTRTAIVLATVHGDVTTTDSATRRAVAGRAPNPILFFQSVATSILSHLTHLYGIEGALTCISSVHDPAIDALMLADNLLDDPSLHQVLVIGVELEPNARAHQSAEQARVAAELDVPSPSLPTRDAAIALLVRKTKTDPRAPRIALQSKSPYDHNQKERPLGWLTDITDLCREITSSRQHN